MRSVAIVLFEKMWLDTYLFTWRQEARNITEEWIKEYNAIRQDAWDNLLPYQYATENA